MILNILILVFLLLMIFMWSQHGLFDAFIHLLVVIVAGSLALALWELIAVRLLLHFLPTMAWGLALLAPFALILLVLRLLLDKLIPTKLEFHALANQIGGGAVGLVSGVLTAGLVVIGMGFLPLPPAILGYQPYVVGANGQIGSSGQGLWSRADRIAASVFGTLAEGAFATRTPLSIYRPDLLEASNSFRLRPDVNSSVSAHAEAVRVTEAYLSGTRIDELDSRVGDALGESLRVRSNVVLVVETEWDQKPGTFDGDSTLRVPAAQVRLLTMQPTETGEWVSRQHSPVGFSVVAGPDMAVRAFHRNEAMDSFAYALMSPGKIAWIFIYPAAEEPKYLFVRGNRLALPHTGTEKARLTELIGRVITPVATGESAASDGPAIGTREGTVSGQQATAVTISAQLPASINKNQAQGFQWAGSDGNQLQSGGPSLVTPSTGGGGVRSTVTEIHSPGHQSVVRLKVDREDARSIPGAIVASAIQVQGIWLQDAGGNQHFPVGYALRRADGAQRIFVNPTLRIRSAKELPLAEMNREDDLYLYFFVPRGTQIRSYHMGQQTQQSVEITAN